MHPLAPDSRTTITVPREEAVEDAVRSRSPIEIGPQGRRSAPTAAARLRVSRRRPRTPGRPQQAEPGAAAPASVQGPVARKSGKIVCSVLVERAQLGEASQGDLELLKMSAEPSPPFLEAFGMRSGTKRDYNCVGASDRLRWGRATMNRRTAVILAADIAGYSRLAAEDAAGAARRFGEIREALATLAPQYQGHFFTMAADCCLAEFVSAAGAVEFAAEVKRITRRGAPRVRCGGARACGSGSPKAL